MENRSGKRSDQKTKNKAKKLGNGSNSEGDESDENSASSVNTGHGQFQVSDEKWNIVLGNLYKNSLCA